MKTPVSSLQPLFNPQSVAIIGASNDRLKFGGRPVHFMIKGGYVGRIVPVHPRDKEIQGLTAYADLRDAPEPVDLAVISIPAVGVVEAVRSCAEAGARSAVIFSSGFAEIGGEGEAWQSEIHDIAKQSGMRVVGPNCMGMLNAESRAVATFTTMFDHGWPKPGGISILSQSGAVGSHVLVLARERGFGLRNWVTTGNEVDVDIADAIAYCAEDPATTVIVGYMEGCRSPDRLRSALAMARRNRKPVIIMKVGRSEVGAAAANTHTASLAGADEIFDAVFRQYGVHRADSLEEMLDMAAAAASGHFPTGNRLGIVTISGGVGVLSSDVATAHGLEVPELPAKAQQLLKEAMPFAAVRNPVDTTAQVLTNMDLLRLNIEVMLDHGDCDVVMVFLSSVGFNALLMPVIRDMLIDVRARYPDRLMVLSMMCGAENQHILEDHKYIIVEDPNRAIAAIASLVHFGESFARANGVAPPPLPDRALPVPTGGALSEVESAALLESAGLALVPRHLAASAEDAAAAAESFGYPVALKVVSADIQHKSDIGAVKLDLADGDAVRAAYAAITAAVAAKAPDAVVDGILVAPMAAGGVETIIGVHQDPVFGPAVLFGLGGVFVEVLQDVTFRLAPFGVDEARRMISEVKGRKILDGVRGGEPADIDALADALARLSVYAAANADRIAGIDVNPLLVRPAGQGVLAVDALVIGVSDDGAG